MKDFLVYFCGPVVIVLLLTLVATAQPGPTLPPLLACQGEAYLFRQENTKLRVQLADREKRLQLYELLFKTDASAEMADLSARCRALEPAYREALKPTDGTHFDCESLTFKEGPPK